MRTIMNNESLSLGVCYYPEQWDRGLWKEDLERMRALGIRVIRVGEFTWSLMELGKENTTFLCSIPSWSWRKRRK